MGLLGGGWLWDDGRGQIVAHGLKYRRAVGTIDNVQSIECSPYPIGIIAGRGLIQPEQGPASNPVEGVERF